MRNILFVLALMLAPGWVAAQEEIAPNPAIERVIERQMDAFSAGELMQAWDFASPVIQDMFGDPERFGAMVESGYPMVWQPEDVRFLGLRERGNWLFQRVQVIDQAGRVHYLDYQMVEIGGDWLINGVVLLQAPGIGA